MAYPRATRLVGDSAQNPQVIRSTAGLLVGVNIVSNSAGVLHLKVYDKGTSPTSSDTPIMTVPIYINTDKIPTMYTFPVPIFCPNGISVRVTAGVTDADTTSANAAAFIINIYTMDA